MVPQLVKLLKQNDTDIIKATAEILAFIVLQDSKRGIDIMDKAGVIPIIKDLLMKYKNRTPISVSTCQITYANSW